MYSEKNTDTPWETTETMARQQRTTSDSIPTTTTTDEAVLKWEQLNYHVGKKRHILKDISGQVMPGEMVAIIGSSGAGKTTLLNALSGRIVGGDLSGTILYHGAPRHPGTFKRATSYVQQDDLMHPLLTVQETLTFSANLRLSSCQYSKKEKSERVSEIIKQLRLEGVKDSYIGNNKIRGVSGGERKRVSIATELLTDPRILFLDEPTSGLDSNSSQLAVELVKKIAAKRRFAALVTIHQPSARIFHMFDKVILLSQGQLVYFGPTGETLEYFAKLGYHCPMHENPADFFVDVMTLDYRSKETLESSRQRITDLAIAFSQHSLANCSSSVYHQHRRQQHTANTNTMVNTDSDIFNQHKSQPFIEHIGNNWFFEFQTLAKRDWLNLLRNMPFLASQAVQSLITAVVVGLMFYYLKNDSTSVQNRMGVLFIIAINATFPVIMPALYTLFEERDIMLRERSTAAYRMTAFYFSKISTFVPMTLVGNLIFIIGVYFISHLSFEVDKFFIAVGILACLDISSIGFMLVVGSAVQTLEIAFVVAPAIVTMQLLFGGLLANPSGITPVIKWVKWINPVYYAYASFVRNEFKGLTFTCQQGEACYSNGEQVLRAYDMDEWRIWQNMLVLILISLLSFVAGYVLLRWHLKPKYIWI